MPHVTLDQAQTFLHDRFGIAPDTVETIQPGAWSSVYAFVHDGHDRIIRFSDHRDDLQRDRIAANYGTPAMPIPAIVELGDAFDAAYAISERVPGGFIDHLSGEQLHALQPALFAMLDDLRTTDVSHTKGYGGVLPDESGSFDTWAKSLLDVVTDHPDHRGSGWRAFLEDSPEDATGFDDGFRELERLAPNLPTERHLIHSDLLYRNLLVANARITGVIDWGCALYGDFLYDLAWFAFYWPWFPAWEGIDIVTEAERHYERIGLAVPDLHERIRACCLHIGLSDQRYSAFLGDRERVRQGAQRTRAFIHTS